MTGRTTLLSSVLLLVIIIFLNPAQVCAQDTLLATPQEEKPHSIRRAALYSAILPGLGQVYNQKAWKVPIIYAGFGVLGYFVYSNNGEYQQYKEAYVYTANGETYPIDNPYVGKYNQQQLQQGMDYYRRNRDLSLIISSLWYVLNIMEAYVDAHFFDYDISEDLTMRVGPAIQPMMFGPAVVNPAEVAPGIKLTLKF